MMATPQLPGVKRPRAFRLRPRADRGRYEHPPGVAAVLALLEHVIAGHARRWKPGRNEVGLHEREPAIARLLEIARLALVQVRGGDLLELALIAVDGEAGIALSGERLHTGGSVRIRLFA